MTKKNINDESEFDFEDSDSDVVCKRVLLDENGVNIYEKSSKEKTVEERIKTSRSLKIKYNNWNNVDWCEDNMETFTIDPMACQFRSSWEDVEFEKKFYDIIFNSKYKSLLLGEDKITVNYQIVNEILLDSSRRGASDIHFDPYDEFIKVRIRVDGDKYG